MTHTSEATPNTADSRTNDSITSRAQTATKSVQSSRANDSEKYLEVIRKDFCRGFTFGSSIELRRFRKLWNSHFGEELSADDHKILSMIRSLTITSGGKSYLPETMLSENIRNTMLKYIDETFESGVSSIYFSALFDKFSDDLLNSQINNAEMLSDYLKTITGKLVNPMSNPKFKTTCETPEVSAQRSIYARRFRTFQRTGSHRPFQESHALFITARENICLQTSLT